MRRVRRNACLCLSLSLGSALHGSQSHYRPSRHVCAGFNSHPLCCSVGTAGAELSLYVYACSTVWPEDAHGL